MAPIGRRSDRRIGSNLMAGRPVLTLSSSDGHRGAVTAKEGNAIMTWD